MVKNESVRVSYKEDLKKEIEKLEQNIRGEKI
jgi:hypothetical protein